MVVLLPEELERDIELVSHSKVVADVAFDDDDLAILSAALGRIADSLRSGKWPGLNKADAHSRVSQSSG